MQLHDIEQKSEEWHKLRLGKITASGFSKLMGTSAAKEKYLYDRVAEIVTNAMCDGDENCSGVHIARGNEWESVARDKYVTATFSKVKEVGLIQLDDYTACSPDGLVGEDGLIEIKVPDSNNYLKLILEISKEGIKAIPSDHCWQMQFCMYVTGRKWCDYVLYNPKHEVNNKDLFVFRVEKDQDAQVIIKSRLEYSVEQLKTYVSQYYGFATIN